METNKKEVNREVIISRIKKLRLHAESAKQMGSLEEANSFASMASKLLLEYNLSDAEVDSAEDKTDKFRDWVYNEPISYADNQSGNRWKLRLIAVICKFNFCCATNNPTQKEFRVYGNGYNVDQVIYMYNFLSIGLLRLAQENHIKLSAEEKLMYNRYAYLKDFLLGAVTGLNQKLEADRKREEALNNKVNSLILYNDKALELYAKEVIPDLKAARKAKTVMVGHGYKTGVKVGRNFQIGSKLQDSEQRDQLNAPVKMLK